MLNQKGLDQASQQGDPSDFRMTEKIAEFYGQINNQGGFFMGLSRSLATGASSLRAHQQRMDVISNNLANANTIGYKSNRANFSDQFYQVYTHGVAPNVQGSRGNGGLNPHQFGNGVRLSSITQNMAQGVIESSERALDMAVQGDGFFIYNMNGRELYSRAGNISQDRDGNLIDTATGAFLQGYNVDKTTNGVIIKNADGSNRLSATKNNLVIPPDITSPPRQTQNISFFGNLNAGMATGDTRSTSINVYDNIGGVHNLTFTFTKTANPNEYALAATIDGQAVNTNATTIQFNADGTLNTPTNVLINYADLNTAIGNNVFATTPTAMTIQLADPNNLMSGITQFAGANTASFKTQDGYTSGDLLTLSVGRDGKIWGSFTNGKTELLGQVLLARFTNQEGLVRTGDNFFSVSPNSGDPIIGTVNDIFSSTSIIGNSLEQSNVDMTVEFTRLITTQRAFEAASRTITVSDTLLAEVNQLKR